MKNNTQLYQINTLTSNSHIDSQRSNLNHLSYIYKKEQPNIHQEINSLSENIYFKKINKYVFYHIIHI